MSEFRKNRPRAHEVDSKEVKHISHFIEDAYSGKTLYAYVMPSGGDVNNFIIFVSRITEGEVMPVNIEVERGEVKKEINKPLHVGRNDISSFKVEASDILFIKARDMKDSQFRAKDITIRFDLIS